jgi:TolB-like protein
MNNKMILALCILLLCISQLYAGDEWFRKYAQGVKASKSGNYELAVTKFQQTLRVKKKDTKKIRTYGMHFIKYFPNREIGVAYFHLGQKKKALMHLQLSARMEPSERTQQYLSKLRNNVSSPAIPVVTKKKEEKKKEEPKKKMIVGKKTIKLVGERMSVAVLPFQNKGASRDLGEIILDKMITALFNQARFKVIERTQLDKILQEQQLGLSGVIDASSAAELGKGLGVDAIIMGSVAATKSGSISIDARAIDTESATIIVAHDAYSGSADALSVKNIVENLANKFTSSLPLVEGTVIQVSTGGKILLDGGRMAGLKKGLKCIIYKEGPELKHPLTGEVLGRNTVILGEALVIESMEKFSTAKIIKTSEGQQIALGDKFLTK